VPTKAYARREIEKLPGVLRTWFEWTLDGEQYSVSLMVRAKLDTDPLSPGFSRSVLEELLDEIRKIVRLSPTTVHRVVLLPKTR
jgi:hypothetical protein